MPRDVTQLLSAIDAGDRKAAEELLPLVYNELRRLAAHRLAGERSQQTLHAWFGTSPRIGPSGR